MIKTSKAGLKSRPCAAVVVAIVALATAYQRRPHPHPQVSAKERLDARKDCFITDKNGRRWPCSRKDDPAASLTVFACPIENRLGAEMYVDCDDDTMAYYVEPGGTLHQSYASVFDPAPRPHSAVAEPKGPRVTCEWGCGGNRMAGVVVWDEQWPEAWSCRKAGGHGRCRLVFESNREVVLVTRAGRRVLGDVAIKECSKNWWGYGGWLPFGLGCTYPKHRHPYYGTVKS